MSLLSPEQLAMSRVVEKGKEEEETGRFRNAFQRTFGKDVDLNIEELNSSMK